MMTNYTLPKLTDPKLKETWVAALRSGEFEQCRKTMLMNTVLPDGSVGIAYCCLGVLGTVAGIFTLSTGFNSYSDIRNLFNHHGWYRSEVNVKNVTTILIEKNDAEKQSFSEIADFVEKHL